jgi:Ca2+-binding EF-hand superfamily protein
VPGFGVEDLLEPAPGFGAEAELFTIEVSDDDRREAERAFRYYDNNRDGKIDSGEMRRSRYGADLPMYDKNRDGVLTLNEMEYRYARRRVENTRGSAQASRSSAGEGRDSDRRNRWSSGEGDRSGSSDRESDDRKSYRRMAMVERLPGGLPDWFARDDADGDGQVAMAEFSVSWTESVLAEFQQFDLNQDGLITPTECLKARENGAVRGSSIGSSPAGPTTSSDASGGGSTAASTGGAGTAAAASAPVQIDARYYEYFKKVVTKYDSSGDGVLTANEWASMSKSPEAADTDGDGRVTVEEYARWSLQQ